MRVAVQQPYMHDCQCNVCNAAQRGAIAAARDNAPPAQLLLDEEELWD
jgi:hypothetical protein